MRGGGNGLLDVFFLIPTYDIKGAFQVSVSYKYYKGLVNFLNQYL
jgi:hypothetical protein